MTDDIQREAVRQELRHAEASLREARLLRDAGLFNGALNRLYYALFHALTALLLTAGVEVRRHRSLPGLVGTHFGAVLDAAERATIARAATYRDLADYERTWEATAEIAAAAFDEVEPLIARVQGLLRAGGWG